MEIVHVGAHTGSTLHVGIDSEVAGKDAGRVVAELNNGRTPYQGRWERR